MLRVDVHQLRLRAQRAGLIGVRQARHELHRQASAVADVHKRSQRSPEVRGAQPRRLARVVRDVDVDQMLCYHAQAPGYVPLFQAHVEEVGHELHSRVVYLLDQAERFLKGVGEVGLVSVYGLDGQDDAAAVRVVRRAAYVAHRAGADILYAPARRRGHPAHGRGDDYHERRAHAHGEVHAVADVLHRRLGRLRLRGREVTLLRENAAQRGAGEPVLLHQRQQPLCVQRIGLRGELNAVVSAVLQSAEGLLYVLVSDYPLGHAVLIHRRSPLSVRVEDDLERLAGAHGLQAFAELRQRQPVGYELFDGDEPGVQHLDGRVHGEVAVVVAIDEEAVLHDIGLADGLLRVLVQADDDYAAGAACAGYGVRQQGADGVGADVRAQAVRLAQDHGAQVLARGVHHEVRAAFACDIRAQGRGLRDDHLARAVGLEQHGIVEADRPAAQHQRGLARQDAHRVHRAHDAVHRLAEHREVLRHISRDLGQRLLRRDEVLGEDAVYRHAHDLLVLAEVGPADAAVFTVLAVDVRDEYDPVAGLEPADGFARFKHRADALVAQDDALGPGKAGRVAQDVDVRAADAAGLHLHEYVVRPFDLRDRALFKAPLAYVLKYYGVHCSHVCIPP